MGSKWVASGLLLGTPLGDVGESRLTQHQPPAASLVFALLHFPAAPRSCRRPPRPRAGTGAGTGAGCRAAARAAAALGAAPTAAAAGVTLSVRAAAATLLAARLARLAALIAAAAAAAAAAVAAGLGPGHRAEDDRLDALLVHVGVVQRHLVTQRALRDHTQRRRLAKGNRAAWS